VLTTMRFAHEIRSPKELDLPKASHGWTEKEMKLAHQLIGTLTSDWDPDRYKDTYTDVLRKVIEQKISGKAIEVEEPERPRPVKDLMKALQASLSSNGGRKELARAPARHARRRQRTRKAA